MPDIEVVRCLVLATVVAGLAAEAEVDKLSEEGRARRVSGAYFFAASK